jgi:hypothetical protein
MAKTWVLVVLAACGSDAARPDAAIVELDARVDARRPDAMPPDAGPNLACLGQASPVTASDPLPVTGKLFAIDHYQVTPVAGATIAVVLRADDSILASDTTASDGTFATNVTSHGDAVDAYFAITAAGFVAGRIDPVVRLTDNAHQLMVVASEAEIGRWYADAGVTYTPGMATLIVAATDCDQMSLAATTATVSPASALTYYDAVAQHWDPTLTASTNGFMLVTAPAATVTVTAHHETSTFPPHTIAAPANTLTVANLPPEL